MDDSPCIYRVERNKELGRYLVAARDIDERELVLFEKPIVCGPADEDTKNNFHFEQDPMCVGCYKKLTGSLCKFCRKCGSPVCSIQCENADHHSQNECQVFSSNNVVYPCHHGFPVMNKSILVLRTLLLKRRFPSLWEKVILKLEHHTVTRQMKPSCVKDDAMILTNLNNFLNAFGNELEDDVIRISGIINVNAFSAMKSDFHGNCMRIVQCIYPQASLLSHSCIPNASWSIDVGTDELKILVHATVPIKKGEMITIAYSAPETMRGTLHRLVSTEDVAHFICKCRRCMDPTEMGTNVSAIKCFDCEKNYLLPKFPINPDSVWECPSCSSTQSVEKIVLLLSHVEDEFDNIKRQHYSRETEIKRLEALLRTKGGLLFHENHYILQEIRMRIINLQMHSVAELTEDEIERLIHHCKLLLKIADILVPGFSKTRALLQFFISQGLIRKTEILRLDQDACQGRVEELTNMHKTIYYLLTRALLFFNIHYKQLCGPGTAAVSGGTNQYVTCIQRQLKQLKTYM